MYKVSVSIFDSCEVEGTETKEYYVIRDTSLSPSPNALMWFQSPMFRQDNLGYDAWDPDLSGIDYFPEVGEYDSQDATFDFIESFRNHIQFNYISDDLYYISKYGNKKEFKQSSNDFIYLLSWGISLDDMSTPMIVEGHEETDPRLVSGYMGSLLYEMPSEYIQWRAENESNDIFVKATMVDSVGNEQSIETLIPAVITFYNYEVIDIYNDQSEIDTAHKKIKLNYSDFTQSSKQYNPKLPDKTFYELYRIFVGKIDDSNGELSEDQIKAQTLITRNTVYCYENDPWSNLTDKCEFEIDVGSRYFVCIQPNFTTHSKTTGVWTGQTFGPAYSLIVDEYGSGNPPAKPVIYYNQNDDSDPKNLKKESCGPNTGKFRITLTIANPQEGVQYVPCYSIDDGQTWSSFEAQTSSTIVFEVPTCLKPPLGVGEIWNPAPVNGKTDWGNVYGVDFFGAIKNAREKAVAQGEEEYYTTPTKIKIIAIKDHASNESEGDWILNFGEDDDNIPPVQADSLIRHDSKLSFDGHYFTYYKLITDEECHPQETFTYYYAPYDESWGDRLSVMDEQSILALPCARSTYQQNCWIEDWKDSPQLGWAQYALAPKIYVNGLEDGNYMFFAKVDDTHGNSSIVTLGKANIGTFKNKLSVKYIKENNKFEAKLVLEDDETSFDRNMICMETLGGDEWYFAQGEENALIDCDKRTEGGRQVLYNLTPDRWTDRTGNDITNQCKMWTGNFYRFTIQSFNENSYNEQTGSGVNYKYGRPYSENEWDQQLSYDNLDTESEYDVCTDETVSNTFYYYVPWNEDDYPEDFSNFMASFFPDTATPISNHKYIVNVISSMRDLGNDPDEWERRGKLIKTHKYDPDCNLPNPANYVGGVDDDDYKNALAYYNNYSTKENSFDRYVAQADMAEAGELGLVYYAAVVHFADNSQVVSDVYTMYGFKC